MRVCTNVISLSLHDETQCSVCGNECTRTGSNSIIYSSGIHKGNESKIKIKLTMQIMIVGEGGAIHATTQYVLPLLPDFSSSAGMKTSSA